MGKKKGTGEVLSYRTVDGREFEQRRLVLGQLEQLVERLQNVEWPSFESFNFAAICKAIGGDLPVALAIVLTEKGKRPQDKNIDELAEDLRYSLPLEEGLRAFKDFFTLNPTASIAESLRDLAMTQAAIRAAATGSPTSS